MKSLDHIFQPKVSKKMLSRKAQKSIKEEKNRLRDLGIVGKELDKRIKEFHLTEMKKVEAGILTGWRKLRKNQKQDMRQYLRSNKRLETIQIEPINYTLPKKVKTHQDFTKYILRQNLFAKIFKDIQKYEGRDSFPCVLFSENWASISKDDKGIYHYFTNRPGGVSVSLNLFDFVEIICAEKDETFIDIRRRLITLLGCSYSEQKWETKQLNKIRMNKEILNSAIHDWKQRYPSMYKLIRSYLDILLAINSHNEKTVISKKYSHKNEALFFLSSRYLADFLDREPSNVRRAINLFACLGLIEKVPPNIENFPLEFLQSAFKIKGNISDYKLITFFIIPQYTQKLLRNAEAKAKKLLEHNITNINKLNEKNMIVVFGEDEARSVYYANKIDLKQLLRKSGVDHSKCKQADTFKSKRDLKKLEAGQGTYGDDILPF